eukprot:11143736-Alexandrium_andersonii.AAC.1
MGACARMLACMRMTACEAACARIDTSSCACRAQHTEDQGDTERRGRGERGGIAAFLWCTSQIHALVGRGYD